MEEIKIGEVFERDGMRLECKEGCAEDCCKCVFFGDSVFDDDTDCGEFACTPGGRSDGKMVYFEEVKNGR